MAFKITKEECPPVEVSDAGFGMLAFPLDGSVRRRLDLLLKFSSMP
jgi:hypothetical protein